MAAVDLIIFGASGDLSARKLFPALFQLERLNLLQWEMTRPATMSGRALLSVLATSPSISQSRMNTVSYGNGWMTSE